MASRKTQSKAGIPPKRRGQQMGDERSKSDKTLEAKRQTPALRGRRTEASKFFSDDSYQHAGAGGEAPSDNSPSVPAAVPSGTKLGESGREREFKARQRSAGKNRG